METDLTSEADSYEIINGDAGSIRSDCSDDIQNLRLASDANSSSLGTGVPLSEVESALAKHVRHLKQENKEIRSAIDNYQEALQLCQENLDNFISQQGKIQSDTLQKYNQAKVKVQKLNEKISSLEKQLQEEKNKHEEVKKLPADKIQSEKNDGEKANDWNDLEGKVSSLRQFVSTLSALTPDEYKTSMSPDLLQDLISLSEDMEKSIKPLVKPDHAFIEAKDFKVLQDELESVKEELKKEQQEKAELEIENNGLKNLVESKRKEGVGVQEVQKELNLCHKEMDNMDEITAGCVSRDSVATEESLHQQMSQSVDSSLSLKFETENQELKKQLEKSRSVYNSFERKSIKEKEKLLEERDKLSAENKELSSGNEKLLAEKDLLQQDGLKIMAENEKLKKELDEKADNSQLAEAIAANKKIEQELLEKTVKYETVEKQLREIVCLNEELEARLSENDSTHNQVLMMKETVENDLKMQVYSLCEELQRKETEYEDIKARHHITETECYKMNSALDEMRKELDAVYLQNERLLTERKGASGAEIEEFQSKIDNLTAQLLSAEEMLEHKEQDLRKLQEHQKSVASELETVPLLKQQFDVFQADFNTEKQTRQKVQDDNRKLRDELAKLRAENERLIEEASDPTGSKMAEMQRRHGCGVNNIPGGNSNPWSGFYDGFIAPRGPPVARNNPYQPPLDNDINRQVSGGRCPKCDRMFPDLDTLQTHVVECLESESTGSVGGRICPKCQESFPDLDTLQIHVMECLDN